MSCRAGRREAGHPDWVAIFGDAQSTCDWPSARYYADLIEQYPGAKVVLTVRTGESGRVACARPSGDCSSPTQRCGTSQRRERASTLYGAGTSSS